VLVPGDSPTARPRVPARAPTRIQQTVASAGRALSGSLAAHRRAAGLTQPQFAEIVDTSLTSVGHAETGRLWQSRNFWERADKALSAGGELLALHDAYRAASVAADLATTEPETESETVAADTTLPTIGVSVSGPVTCVTITWVDGEVTTVYPPESPVRSAGATPACPHG
jgi:hypothetical protein